MRRTADRRSAAWLGVDVRFDRDSDPIAWRKAAHWELNERDFWNEASKREKEAARQFLDKKISRNIAPWYRAGSAT
ncbi:hypothetical protein CDQ92_01975 [Sphingopyxis bauzanensis]|uniref:Uncharacterized protein n=1 Tax=Sphingopyxis bauzanensis TaxID=651663 RepID=A0A246K0J6_9SPHN|nr:hypothetical protein [Sphingopyxis bauzanensis]OWQ98968.1 hypothetical protein CDQ92_01975 [Sphingopyxis bauzanensis]GGJ64835.1 hypothetical protein GCM10011393_38930 [Sphingopyxis bauzanensis]